MLANMLAVKSGLHLHWSRVKVQLLLPTVSNCNNILAAFDKPKQAKIRSGAPQNCGSTLPSSENAAK